MQSRRANRGKVAGALFLVAALLLLSTLFLGWYDTQLSDGPTTYRETLYPTTTQLSDSQGNSTQSVTTSYSSVWLSHTGTLYLAVAAMVVASALLGLLAGALILFGFDRTRRSSVSWIAVFALVIGASGPALIFAAQPYAVCTEQSLPFLTTAGWLPGCEWVVPKLWGVGNTLPNTNYTFWADTTSGPESSFFGADTEWGSTNSPNPFPVAYAHSWGPAVGWYVAVAGTAVLLFGALIFIRREKEPTSMDLSRQSSSTPAQPQTQSK